jgi:hypothetical protein
MNVVCALESIADMACRTLLSMFLLSSSPSRYDERCELEMRWNRTRRSGLGEKIA